MREFEWILPPMKLSRKNQNDSLGFIHRTLFLREGLSLILVVNAGILLDSGVPQFLQQPHIAPNRALGVLQFQAHQILEVGHSSPHAFHDILV